MILLSGKKVAVVRLCFIPRTRLLLAGDENGTVAGWDIDAGKIAFTWQDAIFYTRRLVAAPDGWRVYGGSSGGVYVYDRKTATAEPVPSASDFAVNAAGTRLITDWYDYKKTKRYCLRCWKLSKSGKPVPAWTGPPSEYMFHLPAFFPDGKRFAVFEEARRPKVTAMGADLIIAGVATGKEQIRVPADEMDPVGRLLVHPDGTKVVAVIRSKVVVWDAATGNRLAESPNPDGKRHFTDAAFHPSGHWLATSGNDATVRVWDASVWKPDRTFTWKVGKVKSVAYSPDGLLAAAGGDKGQIVVWDVDG